MPAGVFCPSAAFPVLRISLHGSRDLLRGAPLVATQPSSCNNLTINTTFLGPVFLLNGLVSLTSIEPSANRLWAPALIVRCFIALAMGCAIGYVDISASEVQSALLLLMVAGFATTLPGRASPWIVGPICGIGLPLVQGLLSLKNDTPFSSSTFIAIVPAVLGAWGGHITGRLLQRTGESLLSAPVKWAHAWWRRPISTRQILAVSITVVAVVGMVAAPDPLQRIGHPVSAWLVLVWRFATYIGWSIIAPVLIMTRAAISNRFALDSVSDGGVSAAEGVLHIAAVAVLVWLHALVLVGMTRALFIPLGPGGAGPLFLAALRTYALLDVLVYVLILGLAFASDGERRARELRARETSLRKEVLESRLAALRAQLNPHFLYNALNAATVLTRAGRSDDTALVLEDLTALLRYVLDDRAQTVLLGDELEFVGRYLAIQKVRFGDRLEYDLQCDALSTSAHVPPLILQPLVENAVEHGIAGTLNGGRITIAATREHDVLTVVVQNDGAVTSNAHGASDGIGLGNTKARLAALYGDRASVSLALRDSGGAVVTVVLPIVAAAAASHTGTIKSTS